MAGFGDWLPVSEAAIMLKVTRQRVYQLIEMGDLVGRKYGKTWLVSQSSVRDRLTRLRREAMYE